MTSSSLAERKPALEVPRVSGGARWGGWIFGLLLFITVITLSVHWTDERDFVRLLLHAGMGPLLLAGALQAGTYFCQGAVWAVVLERAGRHVPMRALYTMSVAKLFVDQAIPSAGISGTLLIVNGLQRRGIDRPPVMACVVVETITNFTAFLLALVLALGLAALFGEIHRVFWLAAGVFTLVAAGCIGALLFIATRRRAIPAPLARWKPVKALWEALTEAPPSLALSFYSLAWGTALNFAIHLLDAATLWALLKSIGADADPLAVFAAFMLSTLARTVGIVPGGLGTFEAASVASLKLSGATVSEAVAATLLFRGFSFWLPLVPGVLLARPMLAANGSLTSRR